MEEADVIEFSEKSPIGLELCYAGISQCAPLHSYGPAVRPNHLIHIVLKGKGLFCKGEERFALAAGQGFLIEPDQLTFYQADETDPWEYCWVGFRGSRSAELLSELDLGSSHPVFSCRNTEVFRDLITKIMTIQGGHLSERLLRDARLLEFFSLLAGQLQLQTSSREQTRSEYVRQAIAFIQGNYDQPILVADVARQIGIDRTYLYMLFVEQLGVTPKNYLKAYRLSRARELLKVTNLSIANIAESCGYSDPLVFSKAFRQEYGMTPSAWRKTRNQFRPEPNPKK